MKIDFPDEGQIPELKSLWVEAFGDEDFWNAFFERVFSCEHCRCITVSGTLAAALFWLDCSFEGQKMAYLYAVATRRDFRRRGLCRALFEDVHSLLRCRGYSAAMLVPETDALRQMYAKMGYETCTNVNEYSLEAGENTAAVRPVGREEYAVRRRELLPENSVLQEEINLDLLEICGGLWAGEQCLFAASRSGEHLRVSEFLGKPEQTPGIVNAFGCTRGTFRGPGAQKAFAMFCNLTETAQKPEYFGMAFD